MKLLVLFLLLGLAFAAAESQASSKIVCFKKDEILNGLKGRDGLAGPLGLKGDKGLKGDDGLLGSPGFRGLSGVPGVPGVNGKKGNEGNPGRKGFPGEDDVLSEKGDKGERGISGESGTNGPYGRMGFGGDKGEPGEAGLPGDKIKEDIVLSLLNDYYVLESSYYNEMYHIRPHDLTDGRSDTGGWGSATAKTGNYIQATYVRPVYVSSVTVAGGLIPSWGTDTKQGFGSMDLEYSVDESSRKTWHKIARLQTPVGEQMATHNLTVPATARYWRLISTEDKWVGTTEFALKPLVKSG